MIPRPKSMGVGAVVGKSDEALAAELKAGNADSLNTLFERYCGVVFAIARQILHDSSDAEEVVQDVFFNVYKTINQFDEGRGSFRAWLVTKAEGRSIDQRRRLKTQGVYKWVNIEEAQDQHQVVEAPFHLSDQETKQYVRNLLTILSPRQRRVTELKFYKDLTLKEVGAEAKETPSAVRKLLYGSLRKLRMAASGRAEVEERRSSASAVRSKDSLDASA